MIKKIRKRNPIVFEKIKVINSELESIDNNKYIIFDDHNGDICEQYESTIIRTESKLPNLDASLLIYDPLKKTIRLKSDEEKLQDNVNLEKSTWIEIKKQVKIKLSKSDAAFMPDFAAPNFISSEDLEEVKIWRAKLRTISTYNFKEAFEILKPESVLISNFKTKSIFLKLF